MKNIIEDIPFSVNGKGMYEITDRVNDYVLRNSLTQGQLNLFIKHTSASLAIMENASPEVLRDIDRFFSKLVPEKAKLYEHSLEGDDDMAAHLKLMLTQVSLTIPIKENRLNLGTWQGIYLFEHRYHANNRTICISYLGN